MATGHWNLWRSRIPRKHSRKSTPEWLAQYKLLFNWGDYKNNKMFKQLSKFLTNIVQTAIFSKQCLNNEFRQKKQYIVTTFSDGVS